MKIINKLEFFKLPAGVLYHEYEPCVFRGLLVKGDSWESDYIEMDLIGNIESQNSSQFVDILYEAEETGKSFNLDFDNYGRNGMFSNDQLYAVYEQEDLNQLIEFLKTCRGL